MSSLPPTEGCSRTSKSDLHLDLDYKTYSNMISTGLKDMKVGKTEAKNEDQEAKHLVNKRFEEKKSKRGKKKKSKFKKKNKKKSKKESKKEKRELIELKKSRADKVREKLKSLSYSAVLEVSCETLEVTLKENKNMEIPVEIKEPVLSVIQTDDVDVMSCDSGTNYPLPSSESDIALNVPVTKWRVKGIPRSPIFTIKREQVDETEKEPQDVRTRSLDEDPFEAMMNAPPVSASSKGGLLLNAMGWEDGMGLGKMGQGVKSPVKITSQSQAGFMGLGFKLN